MVSCPACDTPTDPADRFCGRCGIALAGVSAVDRGLSRFCHGCGSSLEPDAMFCRSCGAQAPEPLDDVFAGMSLNGHGVAVVSETVAAIRPPPPRVAPPPIPKAITRPDSQARTETIPRPTPQASRELSEISGGTAPSPRPRPAPHTATATIERPAAQPAPPELDPITLPEAEPETDETEPSRGAFPWGGTLALVGALAVILSAIVDWGGPFPASLPRDISASRLLDPATEAGPSLGVILLLLGTLGALVALLAMAAPSLTFLRRFVGLVTFLVPLGFALRTVQALAEESGLSDLPTALGTGVVMAAVGALLQFAPRRPRRHQ